MNKPRGGLIWDEPGQVTWAVCISPPIECYISGTDIFSKKEKYSYDALINFFFKWPLLITYLRTIQTRHSEFEFNRVYFLRFRTKYDT